MLLLNINEGMFLDRTRWLDMIHIAYSTQWDNALAC